MHASATGLASFLWLDATTSDDISEMLDGQCPEKLKIWFKSRSHVPNHQTGNSEAFKITWAYLELAKKIFCESALSCTITNELLNAYHIHLPCLCGYDTLSQDRHLLQGDHYKFIAILKQRGNLLSKCFGSKSISVYVAIFVRSALHVSLRCLFIHQTVVG